MLDRMLRTLGLKRLVICRLNLQSIMRYRNQSAHAVLLSAVLIIRG